MTDKIVDDVLMLRVGNKVLFTIRRRTGEGKFLPGSSPNARQYSSKPFAMPLGAASKTLGSKISKAAGSSRSKNYDPNNFHVFKAKSGNLWVLVKQGYKKIRQLAGKPAGHVEMNWSGRYMRDLGILRTEADKTEIGWKSSENKELGYYHEVAGAGKSKRRHKILGLLDSEKKELQPYLQEEFVKRINNYFKNYGKQQN
jgi:hypothetical protein